jgi:hypothetical protein
LGLENLAVFDCAKNASFFAGCAVLLWMKALGRASSPDASFLNGSFIANYKIARSPALTAAFFFAEKPCGARQWFFFFSKYASTRSAHKSRHQAEVLCCLDYIAHAVVGWSSKYCGANQTNFFCCHQAKNCADSVPYLFSVSSFLIIFCH